MADLHCIPAPSLLLVGTLLLQLPAVLSHVWMNHPLPRTCFYGYALDGTSPDGPWRTVPCGHKAGNVKTTWVAGEQACVRWLEFVDHPGWYRIALNRGPVSAGDSSSAFSAPNALTLESYLVDNNLGTGYHGQIINVPNITCDHCTLQVRQWADDFQWYYYTCADIAIVAANSSEAAAVRAGRYPLSQCSFESAPSRLRVMILQTILLGTYFVCLLLILVVFVVLWVRRSRRCCFRRVQLAEEDTDSVNFDEDNTSKSHTWWSSCVSLASDCLHSVHRGEWICLAVTAVLGASVLVLVLIGLKSCAF